MDEVGGMETGESRRKMIRSRVKETFIATTVQLVTLWYWRRVYSVETGTPTKSENRARFIKLIYMLSHLQSVTILLYSLTSVDIKWNRRTIFESPLPLIIDGRERRKTPTLHRVQDWDFLAWCILVLGTVKSQNSQSILPTCLSPTFTKYLNQDLCRKTHYFFMDCCNKTRIISLLLIFR